MVATSDIFIEAFIKDPLVEIRKDGTIWCRRKGCRYSDEFPLTQIDRLQCGKNNLKGYRSVKYKNRWLQVHRIIYLKFKGELDSRLVINHLDGNPANNKPENLELVSNSDNQKHKYNVLKSKPSIGNSKITKEIADEIRHFSKSGLSYKNLMMKFSLSKTTISYIINNKIWK